MGAFEATAYGRQIAIVTANDQVYSWRIAAKDGKAVGRIGVSPVIDLDFNFRNR